MWNIIVPQAMFRDVLVVTLQNELRGIFELRKEIEL